MKPHSSRSDRNRVDSGWDGATNAFTLIKLLILIAIITILAAMLRGKFSPTLP